MLNCTHALSVGLFIDYLKTMALLPSQNNCCIHLSFRILQIFCKKYGNYQKSVEDEGLNLCSDLKIAIWGRPCITYTLMACGWGCQGFTPVPTK